MIGEEKLSDKQIHDRDLDWLKSSDGVFYKSIHVVAQYYYFFLKIVLIAEVTQPSLGVGYEIGRALDMNKKILCLFRPDSGRRNLLDCFLC